MAMVARSSRTCRIGAANHAFAHSSSCGWALLLLELLLLNGRLLLQRKAIFDETGKLVDVDHTDHVAVEISTVPRPFSNGESTFPSERSALRKDRRFRRDAGGLLFAAGRCGRSHRPSPRPESVDRAVSLRTSESDTAPPDRGLRRAR